ncbi:butyryl-CoA dehydrogenase [Klebsiella variicola]|uniref:Putative aliphatic sulfonates-binding protein n=7 Tax=Enterobacteriaceae TaxID=543 RepID=A0A7H4MM00_KLEVA|nr:butyryl-CoA dehydrogenase [Klebsiella variicola]
MIHPERDDWARQLTALRQQMAEQAASLDASGDFPQRNIDHLRAGGWLSLAVPSSCGGAGATLAQLQQVIAAIAWGEPATALIVCMQYLHHLRLAENDAWHAPLRQQVFHDAVEHGGLINSLRVEPELGSPARGGLPDTVATRRAEGWDISGHKIYTTGIEGLRWLAVWARSDDNPPLVGTWLVAGDSPGISVVKSWDHAGMRATGSHEVIFNHVRVAAEHAVDVWPADAPPAAEAEPFRLFANRQTALLAAIYDSIAHAAHDWLVRWLAGRVPAGLGHPLSRLPRVQEKVGQIAGLLLVNRSLLEQAAALRFSAIEANLAKVTITDNAIQAVNIALELTGNHGLSRQNPLERHYRNVLCGRVHYPTERQRLAGSRQLRLSITRIITMRLSFSGRVAAALMLLALGGYATAQERITLRIADQKGGMRSQLEAANALQNLPYDIKWAEFPAAAPLAEALNAGAVDAGIIGDAPLLFALANGAPVKAIAVDKSNPAGTAVLVSPGSTLKSGADLKGKRIATGKGSIGHFVALKALEQAGISPKEVQWVFLGPVDAKVALLNGSVDAWATWEPYTTQMVKTNEGQILVSGKGLLPGNTFLAATDYALNDPQKRAALQDYLQRLAGAERWAYANLDSYGKTLGEIIRFPAEIARAQFANRQSQWQPLAEETVTQQQATADFYLANGLIRTRLDVKPTFDPSFSVPAAEVTP